MAKKNPTLRRRRALWHVGQRVSRKDTDEQGTIFEAAEKIGIKWDGGRTSYFNRDKPANVKLSKANATSSNSN